MGFSQGISAVRCAVFAAAISSSVAFFANAEDRMEFRPARDASVRLITNSGMVKGQLKSIAADQVIVIMKDDSEKVIPMTNVRIISTNDKTFTYSPAQEPFDELIKRPRLQGVTIHRGGGGSAAGSDDTDDPDEAISSKRPNGPPGVFAQFSGFGANAKAGPLSNSGGFVTQDGFAGASVRPGSHKPKLDTAALATIVGPGSQNANPATGGPAEVKPEGKLIGKPGETVICSNPKCRKSVTNARYGDTCPHCGVIWLQQSSTELIASTKPGNNGSAASTANPFGSGDNSAGAAAAATPVTSPTVVTSGGFSIETVPWWGKIAGFGGLLAVLWFVSQRRG